MINKEDLSMDRRALMGLSLSGLALSSLTLPALLANPAYAREMASTLDTITVTTRLGRKVSGALAMPPNGLATEGAVLAPTVLLLHEWWGLNDQIKTVARSLANVGYIVLAADLFGGAVSEEAASARFNVRNVKSHEVIDTLTAWSTWLRSHKGSNGKLGTCGWCFGGGWSLGASLVVPVDATVIYYGNVARSAEDLAALKGPVLGHFGTRDMHIDKVMVEGFVGEMERAERTAVVHWYEADHAFANPTTARYDEADAKLAWERTLEFLNDNLA
jgi:carboxymethylenebutenolidase